MSVYKNKTTYDPGRFRHTVSFFELIGQSDGYAGSSPIENIILTTRAIKDKIRDGSQTAIEAGVTVINEDSSFIIRKRTGFIPLKNMLVKEEGFTYVISGVIPIDDQINYYKVLCKKMDDYG